MNNSDRKRKRVVLTLEEKLAVINDRDSGLSFDKVASKFNIGTSTVSEICKRRAEISAAVRTRGGKVRKTLKESSRPQLEQILYQWVLEREGASITELTEKAKEINSRLSNEEKEDSWNPTKSWVTKFKERYGIDIKQAVETEQIVSPEEITWQSALGAAEYLLDYINKRDYLLKDIITVRMIRDRIAEEETDFQSIDST